MAIQNKAIPYQIQNMDFLYILSKTEHYIIIVTVVFLMYPSQDYFFKWQLALIKANLARFKIILI